MLLLLPLLLLLHERLSYHEDPRSRTAKTHPTMKDSKGPLLDAVAATAAKSACRLADGTADLRGEVYS